MSSVTNLSNPKTTKPLDLNDIEMVFGRPSSLKSSRPDFHLTINEKQKDTVNILFSFFNRHFGLRPNLQQIKFCNI